MKEMRLFDISVKFQLIWRTYEKKRRNKTFFFLNYWLIDEFFVQNLNGDRLSNKEYEKEKSTCYSLSLSSSMCCYLYASNEKILFFHLVVSVSLLLLRSHQTEHEKIRVGYFESTKWIECCFFRTLEIIIMYMTMSVL